MIRRKLSKEEKEYIKKMVKEGKTYSKITSDIIKEDDDFNELYYLVQKYCLDKGLWSWQGTKTSLTWYLNRLKKENLTKKEKEELVEWAKILIDYLYKRGRELEAKIEKIRSII